MKGLITRPLKWTGKLTGKAPSWGFIFPRHFRFDSRDISGISLIFWYIYIGDSQTLADREHNIVSKECQMPSGLLDNWCYNFIRFLYRAGLACRRVIYVYSAHTNSDDETTYWFQALAWASGFGMPSGWLNACRFPAGIGTHAAYRQPLHIWSPIFRISLVAPHWYFIYYCRGGKFLILLT